MLEVHEALFHFHQERDDDARAEQTARRLLERFPDHVPTLEALGDLHMSHEDYAEGLELFLRALKINPLERRLRRKITTANLFHARKLVEADRFDEARAGYQKALSYDEDPDKSTVYCKWSACEFKAGNAARAEELLQQALTYGGSRLAVAYSMLIETIRLKLPGSLRTRFNKEFNAALAEPASPAAARAIANTAGSHQQAGVTYHGQKTHEKKVLAYLEKSLHCPFTQEQLKDTCVSLLELEAWKMLRAFTALGHRHFPKNPHFVFLEAESYVAMGPRRCPVWKVGELLDKAVKLARALPADKEQQQLLELIDHRRHMIGLDGPLSGLLRPGMLEDVFGSMMDDEDSDEWDDDL